MSSARAFGAQVSKRNPPAAHVGRQRPNQAFMSQSFAITMNVSINNPGCLGHRRALTLWHTILQAEQIVAEYTYNSDARRSSDVAVVDRGCSVVR